MALTVDKDGKIIEKHLTMSETDIRQVLSGISKADKERQKQVLQRALKVKIHRQIIS
jgi:hypothetical protein